MGGRTVGRRAKRLREASLVAQPKRPSTKSLLLDTAELLFAQYGFEGISLREIAIAAGQANTHAVQYYFEDKAGLIYAILNDRLEHSETRRGELLNSLKKSEHKDTKKMLHVLWSPWLSLKAADGSYAFCRFFLHYMLHSDIALHPAFGRLANNEDLSKHDEHAEKNFPHVIKTVNILQDNFKTMPKHIFAKRLLVASKMFLAEVAEYDNIHTGRDKDKRAADFDVAPILAMALGVLKAPFR